MLTQQVTYEMADGDTLFLGAFSKHGYHIFIHLNFVVPCPEFSLHIHSLECLWIIGGVVSIPDDANIKLRAP